MLLRSMNLNFLGSRKKKQKRNDMTKAKHGTLDLAGLAGELGSMYKEKATKANFLVYGRKGAGKTHLAGTCPQPVLIHSFDPGGTRITFLQKLWRAGKILIDSRYENEDIKKPTAFKTWLDEINRLGEAGIWEKIGTYFLDSGTYWADSILTDMVARGGRPGDTPQLQDYGKQQVVLRDCLSSLLALPCHFVMTGHIDQIRDEVSGKMHSSLLATGKLKAKIPPLFDEFYVIDSEQRGKELYRYLLTATDGKLEAGTRIGSAYFEQKEEPNIQKLLKKAGYSWEHKLS